LMMIRDDFFGDCLYWIYLVNKRENVGDQI